MGRSCDDATKACCSLWLLAFCLAVSGRRCFPFVDLAVVLCVVLWAVLLAVVCAWDAVLEDCFLWVVEDDELLLCAQHVADNAPAKTSANTLLPLQKT
jgi:hypothetical protein